MYCFFNRKLSEFPHFPFFLCAENQNMRVLKTIKQVHNSVTLKQVPSFLTYIFFKCFLVHKTYM